MYLPVAELLRKGSMIIYTAPDTSVLEAIEKMARHNVSSILILENSRQLVGIFTERDLLRRVVLEGRDPARTAIREVMSPNVIVASADTARSEVLALMTKYHCRHIPVVEGDRLLGVVSLRDLLRYENAQKDFEIEQLKTYVYQNPPMK